MARKTIVAVVNVPDEVPDDADLGARIEISATTEGGPAELEILFAVVHEGHEMAIDHGFDPEAFEDTDEGEDK